jgi:hypothetical protein
MPRMHKHGETETIQIMMATTLRDFQSGTLKISDRLIFVEQRVQ